jgi:hypothetical protein
LKYLYIKTEKLRSYDYLVYSGPEQHFRHHAFARVGRWEHNGRLMWRANIVPWWGIDGWGLTRDRAVDDAMRKAKHSA